MTKKKVEIRSIDFSKRSFVTDDSNLNVSGYVNQTGTKSDLLYDWLDDTNFYEVIQPGVFQRAIDESDFVDFYYEHDPENYLASTKDNSLTLEEDDVGLKMSANIIDTTWGQDAYKMIKGKRTAGMSFGFIVTSESWDTSGDTPIRTITGIKLFEVSAVRFPAYPASDIQARNKQRKALNQKLEARGLELSSVKIPKNKEDRDSMAENNSSITSTDINNLVNAIDNQTDCISKSFSSLIDLLSGNDETNSKKTKPTEKRSDKEKDNQSGQETKKSDEDKKADEERKKQEKAAAEKRSKALKKLDLLKSMVK